MLPTAAQLACLFLAVLLLAVGTAMSISRAWINLPALASVGRWCVRGGGVAGILTLVAHNHARGNWLPLEDNFDAFLWLGLLLAAFVQYMQWATPTNAAAIARPPAARGLDWFILPIVILLFLAAALFGRFRPHAYDVHRPWLWLHRTTAYGGTAVLCVSAAIGMMYLLVYHKLRAKRSPAANAVLSRRPVLAFGSLERLEQWTLVSVTAGFALLTIGLVTGVAIVIDHGGETRLGADWFASPKVLLSAAVWLVYALVLHSPINPAFRGRRAAVLSVVGLLLVIGTLVAAQLTPTTR